MQDASPEMMSIFHAALGKISSEERIAYLDATCGQDIALRQRIEALLVAHQDAGSFLQPDASVLTKATVELASFRPGTIIGPYKLLEQIGEGGMGVVFVAEQTQPVKRKVALKVIKPGMDTRQVIARFEAERQALAMMDHINIARVIDGGTTESGRPYFVMELIPGIPITKYCDEKHLTPRERLELFIPVCQAIQHAHQKGIIHRDIKPSNVLVTMYDDKAVPKVIDFGVAKAIDQKLTDNTLCTNLGTMVGTLEYMSPEQADMNAQGIDTRSDIYSLGVLLYELLTGSTPLTRQQLKHAANLEILRMIKEEEPPKPSTRLSDSGEALASISAMRKTEPAKLPKLMRGELDWIVMKTLEKDRNRRYETPSGLARDVERFLADESVEACPPSVSYRFSKFARRNRRALKMAGVVAAALIAATGVSVWQAVKAKDAQHQAEASEKRAFSESAVSNAIKDFLQNDLLRNTSPQAPLDGGPRVNPALNVRGALDRATAKIDEQFRDQPLVEAEMRLTIASAYRGIWEPEKAVPQLKRVIELQKKHLGPGHRDMLWSVHNLELAYEETGRLDDALDLLAEWREIFQATFGPDSHEVGNFLFDHARASYKVGKLEDAERSALACLEIRRKTDPRIGTMYSQMWISRIHLRQKKYMAAETAAREALATLEQGTQESPWVHFVAMTLLGGALVGREKYSEAEPLLLKGYEGLVEWESSLGPHSANWRRTEAIERLVWLYDATNQPDKARAWRAKFDPPRRSSPGP